MPFDRGLLHSFSVQKANKEKSRSHKFLIAPQASSFDALDVIEFTSKAWGAETAVRGGPPTSAVEG